MQLSRISETFSNGEYALSKDLDVAMWLDFRNFTSESPLVDMGDFVMVNADLHDDFDEFKKSEVKPFCSVVPLTELLKLYCLSQDASLLDTLRVKKFGKEYMEFKANEIDDLVKWVIMMREKYKSGDDSIFEAPVLQKIIVSAM